MKVDAIEASIGGTNLILRAYRLLEKVLLNMNCVSRQLLLRTHSVLQSIETEKKSHGKGRTRTKSCSSRQVSHMVNLDPILDLQELKTAAHRWVLDRVVSTNIFNFRIRDAAVIFEERWQTSSTSNVAALVDRGGQYRSPVLTIPNRIVCATTEKGDAKWSARDHHLFSVPLNLG